MRRPCQSNDVSLALQLTYPGGHLIVFQSAVAIETMSWFLSQLSWTLTDNLFQVHN